MKIKYVLFLLSFIIINCSIDEDTKIDSNNDNNNVNEVPGLNFSDKLDWLQMNASSNNNYTIVINSSENMTPIILYYINNKNINITLTSNGAERVILLVSNGSLFTVGDGITLIIDKNITLAGKVDNNAPLVYINNGGSFIMNTGSIITSNSANSGSIRVGGVYINENGKFVMNGGKISGNSGRDNDSSSTGSGGVYVNKYGMFIMNDGEISNNYNSGVYVISDGNFIINNGKILDNYIVILNSITYANGVYSGGTFTMYGGEIDRVSIWGGNFTQNGGLIYYN